MIPRMAITGLRFATAALSRESVPPEDISSVVLVELTGLGDVIAMLPAIQGFQALFPSAHIQLVVESSLVELLQTFQLPVTVHGVVRSRSAAGILAAVRHLRRLHPTLVCSMSPPRRNAFVALASGAPCIAGYLRYTNSLTPYLVTTPVEAFGVNCVGGMVYGRDHISERALMVCRALGWHDQLAPIRLGIAPQVVDRVRSDLLFAGIVLPKEYVVIHPFAGWSYRQWPESAFASLGERLVAECGTGVVFLWEGEKDGNVQTFLQRFAGNPHVLFASTLKLLESAVLISGASLYIGNDSGVPTLGLFGPSDPSLTAPHTLAPASWLYKRAECSPCNQRRCVRPGNPCMNAISVEEALTAAVSVQRRLPHA
jgi:ADP-heptose:LPS heptosyltransferase